ncbi:hypothetical protein Tco_1407988 [Tanacetum coccineum]
MRRRIPTAKILELKLDPKNPNWIQVKGNQRWVKVPTGSQSGHFETVSSSALDTNPSQPPASTPVDVGMHKEDQQIAGGPTSLGVTGEEGAHPQLSSGMSASNLNKPIFLASFIIHSESASGRDASADSTAKADLGKSAPNDSIPQQQGMNEGTKNYSFDYIFAGTNLNVLADKTNSVSEGLESVLTTHETGKGASTIAKQLKEVGFEDTEVFKELKLKDLSKLVQNAQADFMDLNSIEDDPIIMVDESEEDDEEEKYEEVHATSNVESEDTSAPKPLSPRSIQLQELTNQGLLLWSHNHKLEQLKNKAEAEVALLSAKPTFLNVEQLNELLVKSLHTKFSKILSAHDFTSSLPTELKELPSKFIELPKEVRGLKKHVHELEIELPRDSKDIPTKLEEFTKTVPSLTSQISKLKTLQWELPAEFILVPTQVIASTSKKTGDASVPSIGPAGTQPAEGEKNKNQATIS